MTCVHIPEGTQWLIVNTPEHACKLVPTCMFAKQTVQSSGFLFVTRDCALPQRRSHGAVNNAHQECGWDPLAGDVSDENCESVGLAWKNIVEISSHLLGWLVFCGDLEARQLQGWVRQEPGLNLSRDLDLFLEPSSAYIRAKARRGQQGSSEQRECRGQVDDKVPTNGVCTEVSASLSGKAISRNSGLGSVGADSENAETGGGTRCRGKASTTSSQVGVERVRKSCSRRENALCSSSRENDEAGKLPPRCSRRVPSALRKLIDSSPIAPPR